MPLAWASAQGLTPYQAAMPLSVCPWRTQCQATQLPEGGGGGFQPPGMQSVCPTSTRLGFQMPLACMRALTVVPKRTAMLLRVSPNWTVYQARQLPPPHSAGF
jgi:hypothetical protein